MKKIEQFNQVAKKLPPKISNLFWLKESGFDIPPFFVIDKNFIENLKSRFSELIGFLREEKIDKVIIRSAASLEDLENVSRAGFFESSEAINISDLSQEKIYELWQKNLTKLKTLSSRKSDLFLFVQEYIQGNYYGVFFSQEIYEPEIAKILLSKRPFVITEGRAPDSILEYQKKTKKWEGNIEVLLQQVRKIFKKLIEVGENRIPSGFDSEFILAGDKLKLVQIRPIVRNNDEKILLSEKKRLKKVFGKKLKEQIWERNTFTQNFNDLTNFSLSFYNYLLSSKELLSLLLKAGFIDKLPEKATDNRLLENIGGWTYYNTHQEKKLFPKKEGKLANLKRFVIIYAKEKLMREENRSFLNASRLKTERVFAWFFLAGLYVQFFLEKERKKKDFTEKLRKTEIFCQAVEPKPESNRQNDLEKFIERYYFLSEKPYEIAEPRISELPIDYLRSRYEHFTKRKGNLEIDRSNLLNSKVVFWLREKVKWKNGFLKKLFELRKEILSKYGEDAFDNLSWQDFVEKKPIEYKKIVKEKKRFSFVPLKISGKDFPNFSTSEKEKVIVPGNIDFNQLFFLNRESEPTDFFGKFIAVEFFPNEWIPYIPQFKGIVLKEGNELSHTSITCREYSVPCLIQPEYSTKNY